jgi:hypothetical protein
MTPLLSLVSIARPAALLAAALVCGRSAVAVEPGLGLHAGKDDSITQYEAFGEWLGRKVLYRVVFCDRASWKDIGSPWFLATTRQWLESDPERVEVISLPLLPTAEKGNFDAVVSGQRDGVFSGFAEKLAKRGLDSRVIVRLAWEGNGDWYPWAYSANPESFRAAFRRAVETMRKVAPALRIEWCISAGASRRGGPATWKDGYPGDDVVDIISMDCYDEHRSSWESLLNGEAGLRELREFAIAHGKPEAYPEWGCSTNASAKGGGDNAKFVERMAAWFAARPGGVLYQAYWNTSAGGPNAAIFGTATLRVPKAAETYRRLFRAELPPISEQES